MFRGGLSAVHDNLLASRVDLLEHRSSDLRFGRCFQVYGLEIDPPDMYTSVASKE